MTPLRSVLVLAALAALAGLTLLVAWPQGSDVVEWTAQDLEVAPAEEVDAAELGLRRTAIEAEAEGEGEADATPESADIARTLTLHGRVVDARGAGIAGAS